MSLRIDDDKLLKEHKTMWTKIEDLQNIELNALPATISQTYSKDRSLLAT